jgi:hypothetical protein
LARKFGPPYLVNCGGDLSDSFADRSTFLRADYSSEESRMSAAQPFKDRNFLAVIGDEVCPLPKLADCQDSVTGLLLAGIGHITQDQKKNFLIVDASRALQL